jgi:PAS domain S-box-containing protein
MLVALVLWTAYALQDLDSQDISSRVAPGGSRGQLEEPPLGPGLARILVVNDQMEMLRLVDRALGEPYRCEFAATLAQARQKLAATEFALVLCDIQMVDGSGLDLAQAITEEHPKIAVVLITDRDDPDVAREAFDFGTHGIHGYLVKPFWPGQLLVTVMNALRRRELESAELSHRENLEDRRQTIIDRAPTPIYVKDGDLRYVFANLAAEERAGLENGKLVGQTDEAIITPGGPAQARADDRRILTEGITLQAEEALAVGGVERVFQTIKFPLLNQAGQPTAVCGISTDITDQIEALRLRDELTVAQQHAIEDLELSRQETVERLTRAIELHDHSTGEHVSRMAEVAALLGTWAGLEPARIQLLRLAAPMHDIGKIATSSAILRKRGPLTPAEREEMQLHTTVGHEILANSESELLRLAASIALTHHERYDGGGYPRGLAGEEIPLEGRITAVADVFDALLSERAYRPALTLDEATRIIQEGRGSQFDPRIVDLLFSNLDQALAVRAA